MKTRIITGTVWVLSIVSFFTDIASEMLYPVMPAFLVSIGFSVGLIGVLEGIAEATAGLSKGYFGSLSDGSGKRVPFVRLGYTLSALSKPLMAVTIFPLWIFFVRTLDRIGKGVRTSARDAILASESTEKTKARVFGFHRALDTAGAIAGPALALTYLYFHPGDYKTLFMLTLLPGMLAVALTWFLREKQTAPSERKPVSFFSFLKYWTLAPSAYRSLVKGLLFFALINSSDVFLLLQVKHAGYSDVEMIEVYILYNLVYAIVSYPVGVAADRWGLKKTMVVGLTLFAIVYVGMAFADSRWNFIFLFFLYGIFAACTESISKAWISLLCQPHDMATAIGTYTAFQSIATLCASSLAGLIWYALGSAALFQIVGGLAVLVMIYFLRLRDPARN